jgi:putative hydroxymethylpyrimidine transport system permease protein
VTVARLARPAIVGVGLLLIWQAVVWATGLPPYILPAPAAVALALHERGDLVLEHAATTLIEIVAGLALGALVGAASALAVSYFEPARRWLLPMLVVSQAIPVFALAPLLVLWLGYGLSSKIAMAILIIYFPVTTAFYDGLRRTDPGWLDLARVMNGSRWQTLRRIRLPAALPGLASGLRVAAAVAPIGAVIGEWVGSSAGLGYLMLHANARLQIDTMFAALLVLAVIALALYFAVDAALKAALPWQSDTLATET